MEQVPVQTDAFQAMRVKGVRRHGRGRMATIKYDYMHYYVRYCRHLHIKT